MNNKKESGRNGGWEPNFHPLVGLREWQSDPHPHFDFSGWQSDFHPCAELRKVENNNMKHILIIFLIKQIVATTLVWGMSSNNGRAKQTLCPLID